MTINWTKEELKLIQNLLRAEQILLENSDDTSRLWIVRQALEKLGAVL
jgi:hypothetical protein